MDLPLTEHAWFEMHRRGISKLEIEKVFKHPEQKIKMAGIREIWQNKFAQNGKEYVLRIVVELMPKTRVITVYKSSKVKKYWRKDL